MTADLEALVAQATAIVRQYGDAPISLVAPVLLKDTQRSLVLRCNVVGAAEDQPDSVIVKVIRDHARGFSDWASLAFLAALPAADGLVPRFLGGASESQLFVLEDLGGSQTLDDTLRQQDVSSVLAALRSLAICMARMHAATYNHEQAFAALRSSLPAPAGLSRHDEARNWLASQDRMLSWLHATACPIPAGLEDCMQQIATIYAEPGPFLCFSHGDPAPTNNHIRDGRVRLLDFEYGAFRHALYDLSGWNILCPLPSHMLEAMIWSFRQELASACPVIADEQQYTHAWAAVCAYRALAILSWIPVAIIQQNQPWVDQHWTSRHAVLAALARLGEATSTVPQFGPIQQLADTLVEALRQRWPETGGLNELIPRWPAFAE